MTREEGNDGPSTMLRAPASLFSLGVQLGDYREPL